MDKKGEDSKTSLALYMVRHHEEQEEIHSRTQRRFAAAKEQRRLDESRRLKSSVAPAPKMRGPEEASYKAWQKKKRQATGTHQSGSK